MSDLVQSLMNRSEGLAALLLALSGAVFILYVLTIAVLIAWQKVCGR
jgi:hypothetical protein